MVKRFLNVLNSLFICMIVVILYTIVHEGAHALFAVIFGGKVTAFDFNMLSGYPHISWEGKLEPYEQALISIAGPLVPYFLLIIGLIFMNKNRHLFIQKIFLFISIAVLGSLLPNIIIPVLLEAGVDATGEDIAKFIIGMNLNGYVVAFIMAILCVSAVFLVMKRLRWKDAFIYLNDIELHNKKLSILAAVLILIFTGTMAATIFNVINKSIYSYNANIPKVYDDLINVDLKNIDKTETIIYEFTVEEPALYDFITLGNTGGEIELKIIGSTRINGLRTNEMVICSGKGRMNTNYTNWLLVNGYYEIHLTKASSEGNIKIYINSRVPNDTMISLANQEEAILNGEIPQQEYKLAAKARLSDCSNKRIYEFIIDQDKNVLFNIFLTTPKGKATVELVGENYEEELISEYQIKTEGRGSFLKKGKYDVVISSSDCDGDIYLFTSD